MWGHGEGHRVGPWCGVRVGPGCGTQGGVTGRVNTAELSDVRPDKDTSRHVFQRWVCKLLSGR